MNLFLATIGVVSAASVLIPGIGRGATREVPSQYATLQAAISASATGDTILVASGTYTGAGNRNLDPGSRNLLIWGEAGAEATILDGEGLGRAFYIHGGQTPQMELRGLTVRNYTGGAIYVYWNSRVTISECVIRDCHAAGGGDAGGITGGGVLRNTIVRDCSGSPAVEWFDGTVSNCQIIDNTGTAFIGSPTFGMDLLFEENLIAGNGSGFYIQTDEFAVALLRHSVIIGKSPLRSSGPNLTVENSTIVGRRIYLEQGDTHFSNSILRTDCADFIMWRATAYLTCCAYDPSTAMTEHIVEIGPQTYEDPAFCQPVACIDLQSEWESGDYRLDASSPCLPQNSPCGEQIGAYGLGCGVSGATDVMGEWKLQVTLPFGVPTSNVLRYRVEVKEQTDAQVDVVSASGRRIARRTLRLEEGANDLEWREGEAGLHLDTGLYFLRVTANGNAEVAVKFVWLSS